MIEPSTKFRKSARQVSCRIDDEVAILDVERSLYFGLQGTAVEIWDALDQPCSLAELCDWLVATFDVPRPQCETDTRQLLSELQEQGLVEIAA